MQQVPPASFTQFGNSSQRPMNYPQEILWTFGDCKTDAMVGMTRQNPSRPNMRLAVRTKNGSTVDASVYDLIRSSAQSIVTALLIPLKPHSFPKGKKLTPYFQANHQQAWTNAILQLEKQQPLLALCADHWKAKHILQSVLRNKKDGHDDDIDDDDDGNSKSESEQSSKRPRAQSDGRSTGKRFKAAKSPNRRTSRKSISHI